MKVVAPREAKAERGGRGEARRDAAEWPRVPLGELAHIVAGQSPPGSTYRRAAVGLPFFQGKADFGDRHPVARVWCTEPNKIAQPGDVLMSIRAPVGPTNVADTECCIGRGLAALRCGPTLDRDYLLWFLRCIEADIAKQGSGSTFHAINRDQLEALEIPLPPLAEQERIAGRLTEQLGAVERARAAAAQRLAAAEALPAALLREVFDGPQASGWETRTLGDLGPLQTGFAFKSEWFKPEGVRILRNANIHQGFLEWDDVVRVPASMTDRFAAFSLEVGDIVLTLDRPLVANGLKVARITPDDLPSLLNQRVARFRFDPAQLDADYLYAFLRSALFIDAIRGHDQSLGVPHISPAQVEAVKLPLPDLPTQRRLAADLGEKLAAAEGVIARCREELAAIEALPASLLRDAFGGGREGEEQESQ